MVNQGAKEINSGERSERTDDWRAVGGRIPGVGYRDRVADDGDTRWVNG